MRRIAFFFSMRRCSLLETNQRLRRTVLKTPLLTTFLRKRLSRESRIRHYVNSQMPKQVTSFPHGNCRKKIGRYANSAEEIIHKKKRQNDHWIRPYASHSSFVKSGHFMSINRTATIIIHNLPADEKIPRGGTLKEKPLW